jgi:hypothetical protein
LNLSTKTVQLPGRLQQQAPLPTEMSSGGSRGYMPQKDIRKQRASALFPGAPNHDSGTKMLIDLKCLFGYDHLKLSQIY